MAGLNFGQIVEAALSGGLQGYAKQKQINTENDLAQQKLQTERAGMAAKMAPEGLGFDDNGNVNYRSDFYTPGTPAYEAGSRSAQLKREQNYRYGGGMPAELAVALQRGQPVPDQYKNYEIPGYELAGLKPAGTVMNPNNQPATPEQKAAFEAINGQGTAGNLTAGAFNRNTNAQLVGGMAANRQQTQVGAEAERQQTKLKHDEQMATGRFATGQKSTDTNFGKQYNDWIGGDRDALVDSVAQLQDASQKLRAHKPALGMGALDYASQYMPGSELAEAKNQAEAAMSSDLKSKFGSRVSNLDLVTGLKFTYNPRLTPQQNADRLDNITQQLQARIGDRDAKADYFSGNDSTLYGYKPQKRQAPTPVDNASKKAPAPSGPPLRSSLYPGADQSGGTDQIDPAARAASDEKLNIPPGIQKAIDNPDLIAKKEYSAKTNKTRITLKDGTKAVLSGDLR